MSILDVLSRPWAITREKHEDLCAVYEQHLNGVRFNAADFKAAFNDPRMAGQSSDQYTVQDGVAIIPVQGILAKKMNLLTVMCGGMSTEMIVQQIQQANDDPSVKAIMLDVDSPGGEVDGTQQVGDAVAASKKPTCGFIDGLGASAAMWVAAQCDSIYAASDTTQVGSIAVVMTHTDRSKANEAKGVNPTHITTGKYKRILSSDKPLSEDGENYMQDQADYLHTLFVNAMAKGRDVSTDTANGWADGRLFFAQQAIENGLIDGIATRDDVIAMLAAS